LLGGWCRDHGVLHLLTAHHQDDQAETLLLRLGRGSGLAGLAGMAPVVEAEDFRLLRPLLDIPAAELRATLQADGQSWIEDPSNRNPAFARARVRAQRDGLAAIGLTAPRLAETCRHLARARAALEHGLEQVLAQAVFLHPAGFALVDPTPLAAAPEEIRLRAVAAFITTIGALPYPPRFDRLQRLAQAIALGALAGGRTLGGCRVLSRQGRLLVQRELAAVEPARSIPGTGGLHWDGRFLVSRKAGVAPLSDLSVGALGAAGVASMRAIACADGPHHLPYSVWPSLPALRRGGTLVAVPHLGWTAKGPDMGVEIRWRPVRALASGGFSVV
jgi:tRNA(Ile)-lysidine synthase